ncbi:MAG: hypothetical protein WDO71_28330 [Bacteroidota bacterium]
MQTKFYTPHILLQEFVNCIMVVHAEADPSGPPIFVLTRPHRKTPCSFTSTTVSKYRCNRKRISCFRPRSVVVGPQLSRVTLDINRDHKAVRVGFHPGGLYGCWGFPWPK